MTREEEIKCASKDYVNYLLDKQEYHNESYTKYDIRQAFEKGVQWADDNPKLPWISVNEKLPPQQEPIIIAMKNKNKEDGRIMTEKEKQDKQTKQVYFPKFTFDDVLALQCCMETVKKVQEDKELYEKLNLIHSKMYDTYCIEK